MTYYLYTPDGQEISHHNLQDKGFWCENGKSQEEAFVEKFGNKIGLIINPEKKNNPYAPDLLNTRNNILGDLKTQNTPFFKAQKLYGLSPQFTVVFNKKDKERYETYYSNLEIYFAVDWQVTKFEQNGNTIEVNPMQGIWFIPFLKLSGLLTKSPLHSYQQRVQDQKGNAKSSYLLNLLDQEFIRII